MARLLLILAGLLTLPSGRERAIPIAPGSIQPHLAATEDGSFHAVFIKDGNIQTSSSLDQGKTWSAPVVAMDAKGKAKGGMQRGPRIAVDAKKTIYITAPLCFDEAEFAKQYPTQDLYFTVSTDGGKTFSKPVQVNEVPKKAPESLHWLAAAPNGDVFVAWLDLRNREKGGQDLAWVKITDQGKKIGKNQILPGPICECCAPGLAVDAKGNPTLIYREGGKIPSRSIFIAASSNGGASMSKIARLNQGESRVESCPMDAPAVAVTADGKTVAVAWMDMRRGKNERDVQWSLGSGGKFAPEANVHDVATGVQGRPSLAFDKENVAWCAWEDSRSGPNNVRIYAADSKSKKNVQISDDAEGKCGYPSLAAAGSLIGVAYETGAGIFFRVVTGQ
jgi:hypothetical protein